MVNSPNDWNERLTVVAKSDVGMRRSNNQDSYSEVLAKDPATWLRRGHVLVVADGMGAHAAGELASKLAVDTIPHTYYKLADQPPHLAVAQSISEANQVIHTRGQGNSDFHGMGTTCSTMVLLPQGALIGHVGDSRIYRLRKNVLEQLTFDHSLVWEMSAANEAAGAPLPAFIPKNVITRSLGPHPQVQVDIEGPFPYEVGDTFLMCSDGLSGPVRDEELGVILNCVPPADALGTLIDLANLRGGPDNITAIVARVNSPLADGLAGHLESIPAPKGQVNPALIVTMGICLLGAIAMGMLQSLLGAGLCLVAMALVGGVAALQRMQGSGKRKGGIFVIGGPYGKGPHRRYDCTPNATHAAHFAETYEKLRSAATKDGWLIDWQAFNKFGESARSAAQSGQYQQAIAHYCKAIRFMLEQLKAASGRG